MPLTRIDSAFLDLDAIGGIDFDVNSSVPTLKVEATNHRVGIGHNSPAYKLDVVGDVNISSGSNYLVDGSQISTANVAEDSSYLYYTDARAIAAVTGSALDMGSNTITTTGAGSFASLSTGASGVGVNISTSTISGPATLTIDPAAVGDNTGTVVIAGDLQVDGTTTTINSTTLTVDDKNLVLASGAANNAAADGAGITIDTADATLLYKATSDAWVFNKSVGIGTDSPGEKFEVNGKIRIEDDSPSPGLIIRDSDTDGDIEIYQYNSGDLQILNNCTSRNIIFQTHDGTTVDERLRITSAGLVTVGPQSSVGITLDPNGNLTTEGRVYSKSVDTTVSPLISAAAQGSSRADWALASQINRSASGSSSSMTAYWNISSNSSNNYSKTALALSLKNQYGSGAVDLNQFKFKSNGTFSATGNIGIGTDDPSGELHIYQPTGQATTLKIEGGSPELWFKDVDETPIFRQIINANGWNVQPGTGSVTSPTWGSVALIVDESGNVGIGTDDPTYKLHVEGDIRAQNGALILSYADGGNIDHLWHDDTSEYGTPGSFVFNSDTSYKSSTGGTWSNIKVGHVYVDNGNLGTTVGNIQDLARFYANNGNGTSIRIQAKRKVAGNNWNSAGYKIFCHTDATEQGYIEFNPHTTTAGDGNYDVAIGSGPDEIARFKDGGNVGIGTSSPSELLHVNGTALTTAIVYTTNQDQPYLIAGTTGYTGAPLDWGNYGIQHRFKSDSGGTPRVTIDTVVGEAFCVTNPGNVGIGTNSPSSKLDVHGTGTVARFGDLDNVDQLDIRISSGYPTLYCPSSSDSLQLASLGSVQVAINSNNNSTESFRIVADGKDSGGSEIFKIDTEGGFKVSQANPDWTNSTDHPILMWDFKTGVGDMMYMASGGNTPIADQMALVISDDDGFKVGKSGWDGSDSDISSTNEFFRITTAGNVGIGTNNPGAPLHIAAAGANDRTAYLTKAADTNFRLTAANGSGTNASGQETARFGMNYAPTNAWGEYIKFSRGGGSADGAMGFYTGNAESIHIKMGGNVGIGTNNPSEKLHVVGNVQINGGVITSLLTSVIADDAYEDVVMPVKGGMIAITSFTTYDTYPQPNGTGLVYYDAGTSKHADVLVDVSNTLAVSTSTATTVGTFTDGKTTIAMVNTTGTIRIWNRMNAPRQYKITLL